MYSAKISRRCSHGYIEDISQRRGLTFLCFAELLEEILGLLGLCERVPLAYDAVVDSPSAWLAPSAVSFRSML